MKIEELLIEAKKKVHSDYAKMIMADMLNINSLELFNYLNEQKDEEFCDNYFSKIDMLANNKPVQYVIGNVNFYGLNLEVNDKVLIPRFETEELVENTLNLINEHFDDDTLDIIDLGCGSGAIGLTLKSKLPNSNVTLLDISSEALDVSKTNSFRLNLDVNFKRGDMLENISDKFDVIISNPPYIKNNEKIDDLVKDNEPHLALYAGDDGLDCYKKILSNVSKNLKDNFLIAFEIGYDQKEDIINLANKYLTNINIICKKDLQNRDRMIFIMNKK